MGKTESLTFKIEKNHGLYFKVDNKLCTHCAYKYRTMIFFASNYTCTMIPNDQIWYLKQVKDEPPCNPSKVFRVRVRALFQWQNRLKVAVAFMFALDAFAFALCINGPWLWSAASASASSASVSSSASSRFPCPEHNFVTICSNNSIFGMNVTGNNSKCSGQEP